MLSVALMQQELRQREFLNCTVSLSDVRLKFTKAKAASRSSPLLSRHNPLATPRGYVLGVKALNARWLVTHDQVLSKGLLLQHGSVAGFASALAPIGRPPADAGLRKGGVVDDAVAPVVADAAAAYDARLHSGPSLHLRCHAK
ncbi:UNVERIFIED_CONTAM: hypothetical protein K2H54_058162 [Gekko kuhli]